MSLSLCAALPVHEIASEIAQVWNVNLKKIRLRLAQVIQHCAQYNDDDL